MNIEVETCDTSKRYPEIFIDGAKISPSLYTVSDYGKMISIKFEPMLSIGDDSSVEYRLVEVDDEHQVNIILENQAQEVNPCLFKCHVTVKKLVDNE